MCVVIPSTNDDRYVSNADNLCKSSKNCKALVNLFFLAMFCSITKFVLLTVKPFALTHLALGGVNFNPAIEDVGLK